MSFSEEFEIVEERLDRSRIDRSTFIMDEGIIPSAVGGSLINFENIKKEVKYFDVLRRSTPGNAQETSYEI